MKQPILLLCFIFSAVYANAQTRAVTSNGDEVILYKDGTWKYLNDSVVQNETFARVDTNKTKFLKNPAAAFLVKSNKVNNGVYIDPKKWTFKKEGDGQAAEFGFTSKTKDIYGMLITEKIEMPLETLKMAALKNAQEAAADIAIVKEEFRSVNGQLVLLMQMRGTIQGMKFTYLGYYLSSPKGTLQFVTYTSTNLVEEYRKDLEELLNGLVTLPN